MTHHLQGSQSHIISIDIGTSSAKALLCTTEGAIVAEASAAYPCY
jgi:sugar (pentulose or hexulose) kinase